MVKKETHENEPRHRLSALRPGPFVTYLDITSGHFSFDISDMAVSLSGSHNHTHVIVV